MRATLRRSSALVLLACLCVTACEPPGGSLPSPSESTWQALDASGLGISWPYGEPDDGRLRDDRAVRALRTADLALATAYNSHDWSDPLLSESVYRGIIESRYEADIEFAERIQTAERGTEPVVGYQPGPQPRVILDVLDSGDGDYTVVSCVPSEWGWKVVGDTDYDPHTDDAKVDYTYLANVDGALQVSGAPSDKYIPPTERLTVCSLDRLRYGYFDPAPDLTATYTTDDVIPPDGYVDG